MIEVDPNTTITITKTDLDWEARFAGAEGHGDLPAEALDSLIGVLIERITDDFLKQTKAEL